MLAVRSLSKSFRVSDGGLCTFSIKRDWSVFTPGITSTRVCSVPIDVMLMYCVLLLHENGHPPLGYVGLIAAEFEFVGCCLL